MIQPVVMFPKPARLLLLLSFLSLVGCSGDDSRPATPAYDASFMDLSADRCADFYQYACGAWVAQHPAEDGYAEARFFANDSRENTYFWSLLQAMQGSDPSLSKPRGYYNACLKARTTTATSDPAFSALLNLAGSLESPTALPGLLAQLHTKGVEALFGASSRISGTDPLHYQVELDARGYSLERSRYDDPSVVAKYQTHIEALWKLGQQVRGAAAVPAVDAPALLAFESALAHAGLDDVSRRDPLLTYNPIDLPALGGLVSTFSWPAYFQGRGITDTSRLSLADPKFFVALSQLLQATPLATLQQYLIWRVLEAHASSSSRPLIDEEFAFHSGVLLGRTLVAPDQFVCLSATRAVFGFELARHYVNRFVSPTLKPAVQTLVSNVRSAMHRNFDALSWLDDDTRARAHEKLELLLDKVAYPEPWPADRTPALASESSFFVQRLALLNNYYAFDAGRVGTAVSRADFFLSPDTTNAAYRPESNDITLPVAILQHPFYGEDRPAAFDYGGLAAIVGHELTHAFDDQGRHFDGNGALVDWWSENTATEFGLRAKCVVNQYDAYEQGPGMHVDGSLTLGENIADLGGARLAFTAFQSSSEGKPRFGPYSAEQQFFLAWAQVQCSNFSAPLAEQLLRTDPHSPDALRVNGVARNLPEFAQAFSCPAGAPLAPEDRCQVW